MASLLSLDELIPQLQPLDLIFYNGTSILSDMIEESQKIVTGNGDWSHCSIVVNKSLMPNIRIVKDGKLAEVDEKEFYVWESTLSTNADPLAKDHIVDVETGKGVLGVQIRPLRDLIKYDLISGTTVAWCKLRNNPFTDTTKRAEIADKISKLHEIYYHRLYELNPLRMIFALFPVACRKRLFSRYLIGKDWIFCSELVAIVYKDLLIYDNTVDVKLVTPVDITNPDLSTGQYLPSVLEAPIFLKL